MKKYQQFLTTDPLILKTDGNYWRSALDVLLQVLEENKLDTDFSKVRRAYAYSRLAGLALAMHEHFALGVYALDSTDNDDCVLTGMSMYDIGCKHTDAQEELYKKGVN